MGQGHPRVRPTIRRRARRPSDRLRSRRRGLRPRALYAAYEELRTERHLVNFESVLELTAAILAGHPAAAEAVGDRYRYFVVDEYQERKPAAAAAARPGCRAGDRDDVCVVGDPRQTIYSFAGATPLST